MISEPSSQDPRPGGGASLPPDKDSFFAHLSELRGRLILSFFSFIVGTAMAWGVVDPAIRLIVRPIGRIVFTAPAEALNAHMTLSMIGGLMISLPVILYQIWSFVALALTEQERWYVRIFGPLSFVFFLAGAAFGFFVMLPVSLRFLLGFSSVWMVPMITVDRYISFVGTVVLSSGITFELPLLLAFLSKIGIATPEFLRQKRRYAIVIILIVAAIVTPPDVVSQLTLAVPLLILYELGILFSFFARERRSSPETQPVEATR